MSLTSLFLLFVAVYSAGGFLTLLAFSWWDTVERSNRKVYWYPGLGFAGCLIAAIWPAVAFGLYRIYHESRKARR